MFRAKKNPGGRQCKAETLNITRRTSARGKHEVNISLADEKDLEYIAGLFQQARPFYVAADYQLPNTAGTPAS
jgi:hypothetical protein